MSESAEEMSPCLEQENLQMDGHSNGSKKGETNKKVVYVVKNAANMPIDSVISAVIGSKGANTKIGSIERSYTPSRLLKRKTKLKEKNTDPRKVFIKGMDGKESMVIVEVPRSLEIPHQDVDELNDPLWTPGNPDHEYTTPKPTRGSVSSKLRRARSAVRMSVRTLRLPKPRNQAREALKEKRKHRRPSEFPCEKPIGRDDPNYATMMAKFKKTVSRSTLKRHGMYISPKNSYKIDAPYKHDVAPYIQKISDTEFKCKICLSATFRWNYKAEIHILEHFKWKPFECEVCGRGFTQNQYLRKHRRLHFPEDTTFMCEICGKGFQRRYYLTYHMDEHFERTYTCDDCGRTFSSRRKHDEHVRYHHKCNYTVCDICGNTLRTTALARHRKHHFNESRRQQREKMAAKAGPSNDDWTSCEVCGSVFDSVAMRDEHLEDHKDSLNPFQCCVCLNYFKSKQGLLDHGELHNHEIKEGDLEVAASILDELTSVAMVTIPP